MEHDRTDWKETLKLGNYGEQIFKKYFKSGREVSNDWDFRKIGVDFIVNNIFYEVKHTYKDKNELVFEIYDDEPSKKEGWFYYTMSDYYIFTSLTYMVKVKNDRYLKKYIKLWNELDYHLFINPPDNKRGYRSAYIRVPIKHLINNNCSVEIIKHKIIL